MNNITEQLIIPELPKVLPHEQHLVYMPIATNEQLGISKFYKEHFNVINGEVRFKPAYIRNLLEDSFYRSISTIRYKNDKKLTPSDIIMLPSNLTQKTGTTILSDLSIEDKIGKYIDSNSGNSFFFADNDVQSGEVGFVFDFGDITNIGKVQLYISANYFDTNMKAYTSNDNVDYIEADEIIIPAQTWVAEMNGTYTGVYCLNVNTNCRYVKISTSVEDNKVLDNDNINIGNPGFMRGRYCIIGVEIFERMIAGEYLFKQGNGNEFTLDATDGYFVEINTKLAEQYKNDAYSYYDNLLKLKNEKGGVAGIGDDGFISADVIPSIVKHEYKLINSEDELTIVTEGLQAGDIAYAVTEIVDSEGVGTGTYKLENSWILMGEGEAAYKNRVNWVEQSSFTAGSAAYAKQAGNAAVASKVGTTLPIEINGILSKTDYDTLPNKNGVYFVSIDEV